MAAARQPPPADMLSTMDTAGLTPTRPMDERNRASADRADESNARLKSPTSLSSAKSSSRFLAATALISGLTLLSRLLGVFREALLAYYFGTAELLSAYRIAFQVPNLARRLFGEGALSSAMVPVLTETLHQDGEESARRFVGSVLSALGAFLIGVVFVAELVLVVWRWFADDLSLQLTAITLPYAAMICTAAVAGGVLNVRRHFAIPAAAPTLLNVVMLAAMVGGAWLGFRDLALMHMQCWSVLVAGVLQLLVTLAALYWIGFFPKFAFAWRDPRLRAVLTLMAPMALGLSAVQINTLLDSVIAYLFIVVDGERQGTAALGFAQTLYQLPLGVFGISFATAIFPELATKAAKGDRRGLVEVFERGLRMSLFVALPSCVGLILVARPLVRALFERGDFNAAQTDRVVPTLIYFSLGMAAYFAQHIVIRTFYALQDTRTPARIAALMVLLNLSMNLVLVFVMEERGLALATSVCAFVQIGWLLVILRRRLPELMLWSLAGKMWKVLLATAAMTAALLVARQLPFPADGSQTWNLAELGVLVSVGLGAYFAAAKLLRLDELRQFSRSANRGGP